MGSTPRSRKDERKASPKPKQYPARFSREYPVHEGHNYSLNGIPEEIWERAKRRAHAEERSVRVVLIQALDLYGSGRLTL